MSDNKRNKLLYILAVFSLMLILGFVLIGINSNNFDYFISRRVPKVAAIIITGVAIAFSSTVFQTITNSRILTPSVLGLDSLYLLVQTLIIFAFGSSGTVASNKNANFAVSVLLMLIFSSILYKAIFRKEKSNLITLLLVGMIFGTLFQSLSSFMQVVIDPNEFLHIQGKMFASFNSVNTKILGVSFVIVLLIVIYAYRKSNVLDVISLGREQSVNLGISHHKILTSMLLSVSLLVSVSTALVGPITFLGLIAANVSREMLKTYKHKYLLAGSALISIIALVGGQLLAERILNFSTPISIIINFIGGIYFIQLLLKEDTV